MSAVYKTQRGESAVNIAVVLMPCRHENLKLIFAAHLNHATGIRRALG
jgi:hypothetical protein